MWCELNPYHPPHPHHPSRFATTLRWSKRLQVSQRLTHPAKPNAACASWLLSTSLPGLDAPRWLATPTGDVLVTKPGKTAFGYCVTPTVMGWRMSAKPLLRSENGLNIPFGMAFANGSFFLGNTDAVLKFPYTQGQQQITLAGQKIADLPVAATNTGRAMSLSHRMGKSCTSRLVHNQTWMKSRCPVLLCR